MKHSKLPFFLITLFSILVYLPFLGQVHLFDWDEINFAEAAREMILTQDYGRVQIGFEPFWEKPPLFHWMQLISMKIFGITEFAARFPNFIAALITLNLFFYIGRLHHSVFLGWSWVLVYASSLAPTLYFKTGIIDPWFNLFIFCGIYQLFLAHIAKREDLNPGKHFLFSGIFSGLAVLTKGPVAVLIIFLVWLFLFIRKGRSLWPGLKHFLIYLFTTFIISGAWFIPETIKNGPWFLQSFIEYQLVLAKGQIPWHNQPFYYHLVVLFFLCFPASILALTKFGNVLHTTDERYWFHLYMKVLFWVVLILFSIVKTKIIHYSSLCWIPLTYMAAHTLSGIYTLKEKQKYWIAIPGILATLVLGFVFTAVPFIVSQPLLKKFIANHISDPFTVAALMEPVNWNGWEWVPIFTITLIIVSWWIALGRKKEVSVLFFLTTCFIFSHYIYIILLPKIEMHLQGKMIGELKNLAKKDVYIGWAGFKTYAVHYYGNTQLDKEEPRLKEYLNTDTKLLHTPGMRTEKKLQWLMNEKTEKPVYFLTRNDFKTDSAWLSRFVFHKKAGSYLFWRKI